MVTVKSCETSYKQRCYGQALQFEAGWTLQKITDNQKLSVGTVWNICKGPTLPKKKKGCPLILKSPTRPHVIVIAIPNSENRQKPLREIVEICRITAGERTLWKALKLEGYNQRIS